MEEQGVAAITDGPTHKTSAYLAQASGPWPPLHSPGAVLAHDHPLYSAISFSTEYAHPQQIASVSDSIAMTFFTKEF